MSTARGLTYALAATLLAAPALAAEALDHRPHCQRTLFCLSAERRGDEIALWLDSETDLVLTLVVGLETRNLDGPAGPLRHVIEGPGRSRLARLRVLAPGDWSLDWRYSFHPGAKPARHDPAARYRLPYRPGTAHHVIQGPLGPFSHRGPLAHAVDWAMPPGTPVLAARAGRVVGLRSGGGPGGPDPALAGQENFVWLRHADGTVGHYLHLEDGSIQVALGDAVAAGQTIARSGASGYGSEPHLHFHVSTPTVEGTAAFESFPLRFDLGGGRIGTLETGRSDPVPRE